MSILATAQNQPITTLIMNVTLSLAFTPSLPVPKPASFESLQGVERPKGQLKDSNLGFYGLLTPLIFEPAVAFVVSRCVSARRTDATLRQTAATK